MATPPINTYYAICSPGLSVFKNNAEINYTNTLEFKYNHIEMLEYFYNSKKIFLFKTLSDAQKFKNTFELKTEWREITPDGEVKTDKIVVHLPIFTLETTSTLTIHGMYVIKPKIHKPKIHAKELNQKEIKTLNNLKIISYKVDSTGVQSTKIEKLDTFNLPEKQQEKEKFELKCRIM